MIAVIAEHADQTPSPVTGELVAFARGFPETGPAEVLVVALDNDVEPLASRIAADTGCSVLGLRIPGLSGYNGDVYCRVLETLFTEKRPEFICVAHTYQGLDFAPALAARLKAACVTGVDQLRVMDGHLCFRRPAYGGKLVEWVTSTTGTTVVTVQPGVFRSKEGPPAAPGSVTIETCDCRLKRLRRVGIKPPADGSSGISEAEVIVAASRGIGEIENLSLIRRLAGLFPKSAVAGSRIVCDAGWLEYNRQVGITGSTVTPSLYIACGISGAVQHVMGMRGAGFVVAINTDRHAAIFNDADVCVVEDLRVFIPAFIELCNHLVSGKERSHD